jgi:hypothetical protein
VPDRCRTRPASSENRPRGCARDLESAPGAQAAHPGRRRRVPTSCSRT